MFGGKVSKMMETSPNLSIKYANPYIRIQEAKYWPTNTIKTYLNLSNKFQWQINQWITFPFSLIGKVLNSKKVANFEGLEVCPLRKSIILIDYINTKGKNPKFLPHYTYYTYCTMHILHILHILHKDLYCVA